MKRDGTGTRMRFGRPAAAAVFLCLCAIPLAPPGAMAGTLPPAGPAKTAPVVPSRPAPKDLLYLRENPDKPIEVEVLKETATDVQYRMSGSANVQRRYHNDIVRLVYGDAPPAWREAQRLLDDGKAEDALARIELAAGGSARPSWFAPASQFLKAQALHALARGGKAGAAEQAEAAYLSYRERFKDHKNYDESAVRLAELYVEQKNLAKADPLVNPSARARLRGKWVGEARFVHANVYRLQGNHARAQADFELLMKDTKKEYPELSNRARFELGVCLIENKKEKEALKHFQDWVAEAAKGQKPPLAAKVGLGEALLASGSPKGALLEFVEVATLGFENRNLQARAWLRAGEAWEKLGKPDEAKKRFAQCAANYPDTEWGRLAKGKI